MPATTMTPALNEAIWLTSTLPIRLFGDAILTSPCAKITDAEFTTGQARDWANQLDGFMQTYRARTGLGRGLAANQIGIAKQLIWVWDGQRPAHYANPRVTSQTGAARYPESCISGATLMIGDVERPWAVTIAYQDLQGRRHTAHYDGLAARLLQHEIDHLNGLICTDQYLPGTMALATDAKTQALTPPLTRLS